MDVRLYLAERLRSWRIQSNMPLKQLADELGVSLSTVAAWESGARFPGADNLAALAHYTGIPPCQFVCSIEACRQWPPSGGPLQP